LTLSPAINGFFDTIDEITAPLTKEWKKFYNPRVYLSVFITLGILVITGIVIFLLYHYGVIG